MTYEMFLFHGKKKRKDAMCLENKTTVLVWEFCFLKCLPFAHPKKDMH